MLDWRQMAAQAATLDERLSGQFQAHSLSEKTDIAADRKLADTRLRLWCDALAQGDWQSFQLRLQRDGLGLEEVHSLLGELELKPDQDLPPWINTAHWVLESLMTGPGPEVPDVPAELLEEVAFADLLWPVVQEARRRRDDTGSEGHLPEGLEPVTPGALGGLDKLLLSNLSQLAGLTFFESFNFFRLTEPEPVAGAPDGRGLYLAFIEALRAGPLLNLINQKPVLLRLLALSVDQWIKNTRLFLARLANDRECFGALRPRLGLPKQVVSIQGGLSDPHFGGQCVFQFVTEGGARWLYKPRDLALDAAWDSLLTWLADKAVPEGLEFSLPSVKPFCRDGYGWLPYVPHDLTLTSDEVPGYFNALGQILAIMELLSGSDMHMENIRVAEGLPVVIDLETLLQPDVRGRPLQARGLAAEKAVNRELVDTVLRVGLLPEWISVGGTMMGMSGLTPKKEQGYTAWRLQNLNRDDLSEDRVRVTDETPSLLPLVAGQEIKFSDQIGHLVAGYEGCLSLLGRHQEELLSDSGPLAAFVDQKVRIVARPTVRYGELRQVATWPANQSDGFLWSLRFEDLGRAFVYDRPHDPFWPLFRAEREALCRLDIPVLQTLSTARDVWLDDQKLTLDDSVFEDPAFTSLAPRLARMKTNRERSKCIIRQTAYDPQEANYPSRAWPQPTGDFEPSQAEALAFSLARHLASQARREESSLAWVAANILEDGSALKLGPLPDNLYEGQLGPALFLAACYAISQDEIWRDLALNSLSALRLRISEPEGALNLCQQIGIGGFAGMGSLVYSLCQLADLLQQPELLQDGLGPGRSHHCI